MFSIRFISDTQDKTTILQSKDILGEIIIGDFRESFTASLDYWTVEKYKTHWTEALKRVISREKKSCLITNMNEPRKANFITWWIIYRESQVLFFQNQILFLKGRRFDPTNPFSSIQDRLTHSENGRPISEWSISLNEIYDFLAYQNKQS